MSQATFDSTTSGGPTDDSGAAETRETRAARGQNTRRRPSRRGHAAKATTEATAQPTTAPTAEHEPATAPVSAAPANTANTPSTTAPAAPAAEESGARAEGRSRRSRGATKRPAARGKAGAQLVMPKANDEAQQTQPAVTTEGEPAETAHPAAEQTAPATAEQPATAAGAAPTVVPVVSAGAEEASPATPRRTRFGLPRRLRQPEATPAVVPPPLVSAEVSPPTEPIAEAAVEPITEAAVETGAEAGAPRYRFDRSRRTTLPGVTYARPERLSSQRSSLYTGAAEPATTSEPTSTPTTTPEPAAEPSAEARQQLFDLPPLESLVGGAAELPTLAFDEPTTRSTATREPVEEAATDEAEQTGEEADGEGAGASSRRRRRRRRSTSGHNGAHGAEADEAAEDFGPSAGADETLKSLYGEEPLAAAEPSEPSEPSEPYYQEPQPSARAPYAEPGAQRRSSRFGYPSRVTRRAPAEPGWEAPQQPTETSPYGGPEPSYARGFGPTPNGVAAPLRESYPRPSRVERSADVTAGTVAQLGATIREAINTQTDRLLTELRHQQPPAVTLSIPNAQTAERVGVFVDVANVVYSARGLRTSVDFGRLLDFLRANRRLSRAQAYAPTNPEQGADQAFLNAVKGLGYRITTKNYKTFSNGAKKADLDLDLCMDIVRLVESRAVDTIVLVSGDSDFLPLLDYCTDHGVRVEVAAFDDAASMILRQSCDLFVNLSLVDGIRG